jgi:hypothetical protein
MWHVVLKKRILYISRIIIWERALEMRQELFYFVSEIFQYSVKAHVWMTCLNVSSDLAIRPRWVWQCQNNKFPMTRQLSLNSEPAFWECHPPVGLTHHET